MSFTASQLDDLAPGQSLVYYRGHLIADRELHRHDKAKTPTEKAVRAQVAGDAALAYYTAHGGQLTQRKVAGLTQEINMYRNKTVQPIYDYIFTKAPPVPKIQSRTGERRSACLKCGVAFDSTGSHERICARCKLTKAFTTGAGIGL